MDLKRSKTPVPKYVPVISNFTVDSNGRFWVGVNTEDEDNRLWMIFDKQGEKIGEIKLPSSINLEIVAKNYAYGVQMDELGLMSVIRYKILEK